MGSLFLPIIMCFWRLWIIGIKGLEAGLDVGLGFDLEFSFCKMTDSSISVYCSFCGLSGLKKNKKSIYEL
jgi:hypothetical protein